MTTVRLSAASAAQIKATQRAFRALPREMKNDLRRIQREEYGPIWKSAMSARVSAVANATTRRVFVTGTRADFGKLSVVSLYLPSGSSSPERQEAKFRFMALFYPHLMDLAKSGRDVVVCGDWNIAHQEKDLKNWKSNARNSGFLPEERAWVGSLLDEGGWRDVYL